MTKYILINPRDPNLRSQLYNTVLKHKKWKKTTMIVDLDEREAERVQTRYKVSLIPLNPGGSPEFKKGFIILNNIFQKLLKDSKTKSKIKKELITQDGKPSDDYITITKLNEMMKNND